MGTITAYTNRNIKKIWSAVQNFTIANSVTIPVGAYTMLPGTSGDTANRGLLDNYTNMSTAIYVGLCEGWGGAAPLTAITNATVVGNTAPANPYQAVMASVETGPHILRAQSITGGSAQTDVGKKIWMLNNNDFTFTSQLAVGLSNMVGRCVFFNSATSEDILLYGMLDADLLTS
jgi:hypothetical protein